ncbi:FecR family protein, partial [Ramlibacter sp.]|uniref:FecR family protein n=1 Tax=Ramlibacter sp. TaxID=1917967 RepID=UPI0017B903B2
MKTRFKPHSSALALALSAAFPLHGFAAAGITQYTAGDVTRISRGASTPLVKGTEIESGDAIVTGPGGRAQVRFSDGGMVSVAPNSSFRLTGYSDAKDPSKDQFLVDFLRGSMRAITGLIGKRNTANYKVITATATLGIRGSAFNLGYIETPAGNGVAVSTEQDEIEICTKAGCVGLKVGESARVFNNDDLPTRTNLRASLPVPEPRQMPGLAANDVNAQGLQRAIAQTTGVPPAPPAPAPSPPPPAPPGPPASPPPGPPPPPPP